MRRLLFRLMAFLLQALVLLEFAWGFVLVITSVFIPILLYLLLIVASWVAMPYITWAYLTSVFDRVREGAPIDYLWTTVGVVGLLAMDAVIMGVVWVWLRDWWRTRRRPHIRPIERPTTSLVIRDQNTDLSKQS